MPSVLLNDTSVFYAHSPSDSPRNLILIHGAGGQHLHWPREIRRFPEINIYALDLPGHGKSGGGGFVTLEAYAQIIIQFIQKLDLKQVILAGHSMGGGIALQVALNSLPQLTHLVLVSTGAKLGVSQELMHLLKTDAKMAVEKLSLFLYGPRAPEVLRNEGKRELLKVSPQILHDDFFACGQFDIRDQVKKIQLPSLILVGEEDPMTPPKFSDFLASELSQSTLKKFPQVGHMLPLENPNLLLESFVAFLEGY